MLRHFPLCLIIIVLFCHPAWTQDLTPRSLSRYERIVLALKGAPEEWRSAFADVAIVQLAEAYLAESELARAEASIDDAKLLRWSRAVAQYANQLIEVQQDVELGMPVTLTRMPGGEIAVAVGEHNVMLTHPRPEQQPAYEQWVLEHFCQSGLCEPLTEPTIAALIQPDTVASIPVWEFNRDGPACTYKGIRIQFVPDTALAQYRQGCVALAAEINNMLRELLQQSNLNVRVDWSHVAIHPLSHREHDMLTLNAAGDTAVLALPILQHNSVLLQTLVPWFAAQMRGEELGVTVKGSDIDWQAQKN